MIVTKIALCFLTCLAIQFCASVAEAASPAEIVAQLETSATMYQDDASAREALTAQGDAALLAIADALQTVNARLGVDQRALTSWRDVTRGVRPSSDRLLASSLLRCAAGIHTDAAIALIVRTIGDSPDPWVKWRAVFWLEKRVIQCPIEADEKAAILRFLQECDGCNAGTAAMVLANCVAVPAAERVPPILERFLLEVQAQPEPGERARDSYVSPRVLRLNPFLRAFRDAGEAAVPYLRSESGACANDPEMRKWLVVARGMAGDAQVAAELEKIVREDPDMSTRVEATRAYARAAKETAIPLLVELLDDPTAIRDRVIIAGKGEGIGMLDGFRPVAGVAADELSRLGHHDLVLSHRQSAGSQGTQTAPGG
jgi:hypothetical protein